jgi:hypothetical protein
LVKRGAGAVGTGIAAAFSTAFPAELTSTAHIVPPTGDFLPISTARISPLSSPASAIVRLAVSDFGEIKRPERLGSRVKGRSNDLRAGSVAASVDEVGASIVHSLVSESWFSSDLIKIFRKSARIDIGVSLGQVKKIGILYVTGSVEEGGSTVDDRWTT